MGQTRVMIVDDAVVVRRVVTGMLQQEPELEVVGTSPNGRLALAKMPQLNPDIIICDMEMPEMDGLQLMTETRRLYPRIRVILFTSCNVKESPRLQEALSAGGLEMLAKPGSFLAGEDALKQTRDALLGLIRSGSGRSSRHNAVAEVSIRTTGSTANGSNALAGSSISAPAARTRLPLPSHSTSAVSSSATQGTDGIAGNSALPATVLDALPSTSRLGGQSGPRTTASSGRTESRTTLGGRIDAVVIGVSTGGPNALAELLPDLPRDFPVPILIVQHMPPVFTRLLAERLSTRSVLPVEECVSGTILTPGRIWIAPGNFHMIVERDGPNVRMKTHQGPPENSCRPAVDVLFRSAADVFGGRTLAVVLTGMGQDGFKGCEVLRDVGAQIIAQDESSSVVWGMPGFVARAGLASKVLPLNQIAMEIVKRTTESRTAFHGRSSAALSI